MALLNGSAAQKKALLRQLIHEIPTDGRRAYPKYRVPMQEVRIVGTLVGRSFRNANRPTVVTRPISLGVPDAGAKAHDAPIEPRPTRVPTSSASDKARLPGSPVF